MQAGPTEEKWRNIGAPQTMYRNSPPRQPAWIFSPIGRYGFYMDEEKANPEIENIRDVTHRYYICNVESGSWTEYKSNTGIFKIGEDKLVVTDFSLVVGDLISGCLRQHILELNHNTKEVNCNISRSYSWNVDKIHGGYISNDNAVDYKGDAYIAITGDSSDQLELISCRLLPFNPLSLKPPLELVIHTDAIKNTIDNNARFYHKIQPFCNGSRLVFRLSEDIDPSAYTLPNEFFTIDLKKVQLDRNGFARIGMPEASLGLLKLPALNFHLKNNWMIVWSNAEYIIKWYQFKDDESSEDASEPKECEVFIVNLREASIIRMNIAMKWEDWLTIHPSGALLHWRQSAAGVLQCLNRPRPLFRPPSLFNLSRQRLLMTDSHKPEDKFINGLLFENLI